MDINMLKTFYKDFLYVFNNNKIKNNKILNKIIVLIDNEFDPNRKILILLLKHYNNFFLTTKQFAILDEYIIKLINSKRYNIHDHVEYIQYALNTHNVDFIEALLLNNAKYPIEFEEILYNIGYTYSEVQHLCKGNVESKENETFIEKHENHLTRTLSDISEKLKKKFKEVNPKYELI